MPSQSKQNKQNNLFNVNKHIHIDQFTVACDFLKNSEEIGEETIWRKTAFLLFSVANLDLLGTLRQFHTGTINQYIGLPCFDPTTELMFGLDEEMSRG